MSTSSEGARRQRQVRESGVLGVVERPDAIGVGNVRPGERLLEQRPVAVGAEPRLISWNVSAFNPYDNTYPIVTPYAICLDLR